MTQITNEEIEALKTKAEEDQAREVRMFGAPMGQTNTILSLISTITQLRARAEAAELKGWNEAIEAAHREADLEWWGGDRHRTSSTIGPVICSKIRALKKETN